MSIESQVFQPHEGGVGSVSITVLASSASVAVPKVAAHETVRLFNSGTNVVFVRLTNAAGATAVVTDMAMAPNSVEVFKVPAWLTGGSLYVAAIAAAIGNTLYVTPGDGQ
jgi:hypothetical protein